MPSIVADSEGPAVLTDALSTTQPSPDRSPTARPSRYNPRLLGGGAVVPYIGSWTGEEIRPTTIICRPGGGIGYADETILDRDEWGVLWARMAGRIGVGKPLFTELHPVRQRRAMLRLLCQVCAMPADRSEDGNLWLVPEKEVGRWEGWPEGMSTIHPPLCGKCAKISVRMCPALRPRWVAMRAHSRACGVTGAVFAPGGRFPRLVQNNDEVIQFGDPAIRWVQAALLARTLFACMLVDLGGLS